MAFPSTYQFSDDFTRSVIGPFWINDPYQWGAQPFTIVANQLTSVGGDAACAYIGARPFPDAEAYITIRDLPDNGMQLGLKNGIGSLAAHDGYEFFWLAPNTMRLQRRDNDGPTPLGADITFALNVGDQVGIQRAGSFINVWVNGVMILQRTDATYAGPWYVTLETDGGNNSYDLFGGGNLGQPTPEPIPQTIYGRGAA